VVSLLRLTITSSCLAGFLISEYFECAIGGSKRAARRRHEVAQGCRLIPYREWIFRLVIGVVENEYEKKYCSAYYEMACRRPLGKISPNDGLEQASSLFSPYKFIYFSLYWYPSRSSLPHHPPKPPRAEPSLALLSRSKNPLPGYYCR
jgi:hypothetical protein